MAEMGSLPTVIFLNWKVLTHTPIGNGGGESLSGTGT